MKKMKKIAILLSLVMVIQIPLSINVFGEEGSSQIPLNNASIETTPKTASEKAIKEKAESSKIIFEDNSKRESNIKTFVKDDGTYVAEVYPSAVHYKKNGRYEDIDNTLVSAKDDNTILQNKANDFNVKFQKTATSDNIASVSKGGNTVKWSLEGVKNSNVKTIDDSKSKELTGNAVFTTLKNIKSKVSYDEILEGVNLDYELNSDSVKENIVLSSATCTNVFDFNYDIGNLKAVQNDDNSISLVNPDTSEIVFTLDTPVMKDAKGQSSNAIALNVQQKGSITDISLEANKEWLSDPDRAYPVNIDPTIYLYNSSIISDSYVDSSTPTTNYGALDYLKIGATTSSICRTYVKMTLPTLSQSAQIVDANYYLYCYSPFTPPASNTQLNLYNVTSSWTDSTIKYSQLPSNDSIIKAYSTVTTSNQAYDQITWDITSSVNGWYSAKTTDVSNYGFMIKANNESPGTNCQGKFYSINTARDFAPYCSITYLDTTGIEDYMTYQSQDMGRSGSIHLNDFSGNVVYTHTDLEMSGNLMPVSVSHVYNNSAVGQTVTGLNAGSGFRLNLFQKISSTGGYNFTDEDGTVHYFDYNSSTTNYIDKDNLGLTLKKDANQNYTILTDDSGGQRTFTTDGRLSTIQDNNGNTLTLSYNLVGANYVLWKATDGANRQTIFAYDGSNMLTSIKDPSNRYTYFYYSSGRLDHITYPDSKQTQFSYTQVQTSPSMYYLNKFTAIDGRSTVITYSTVASPYRPATMKQMSSTSILATPVPSATPNQGQSITGIAYNPYETIYTDDLGRKTVCEFDYYGHTVCITDGDGNSDYSQYGLYSDDNNRIVRDSQKQLTAGNYILNHDFEATDIWTEGRYNNPSGSTLYSTEQKYSGSKSMKIQKTTEGADSIWRSQSITLIPGNTYTYSGYIRTSPTDNVTTYNGGGAYLYVTYTQGGVSKSFTGDMVTGNITWRRYYLTFTLPSDATSTVGISCNMKYSKGSAYFDCVQVDDGMAANKYNLLENNNLSINGTSNVPKYWTFSTNGSGNGTGIRDTSNCRIGSAENDQVSFRMTGCATQTLDLNQTINVNGSANDVFGVGAWAKANSVKIDADTHTPSYSIAVTFNYTDGSNSGPIYSDFNYCTNDWQYIYDEFTAGQSYSSVKVQLEYGNNVNIAYFDDPTVIKGKSNLSYTYVSGDLTSSSDTDNNTSSSDYTSDSEEYNSTNPAGGEGYSTYDSLYKQRMVYTVNESGTSQALTYDTHGNSTQSTISSVKSTTTLGNNRTYYIKAKHSGLYLNVDGTQDVNGANIEQYKKLSNSNQQWRLVDLGTGYFKIVSVFSPTGKVLDVAGAGYADGTKIEIWSDSGGTNQQWKITQRASDGTYTLIPRYIGNDTIGAAVYDELTTNDTSVQLWTINTPTQPAANQSFYFEEVGAQTTVPYISTSSTYSADGNYLASSIDDVGNTTTVNFDSNKGLLSSVQKPNDTSATKTNYNYNSNTDKLTSVSKTFNSNTYSDSYSYANDYLTNISHNSFNYTFGYDKFGNTTTVGVANRNLVTNTFTPSTGLSSNTLFGNGNSAYYYYDNQNRLTKKVYDSSNPDTAGFKCGYDSSGNLAYMEDDINNPTPLISRYVYDFSNKFLALRTNFGFNSTCSYDANSNANKKVFELTSYSSWTNDFIFDNSNKLTSMTWNIGNTSSTPKNGTLTNTYDGFDRITQKKITTYNNGFNYSTNITYKNGGGTNQTTALVSTLTNGAGSPLGYTYDANRNIKTVSKDGDLIITYYYDNLNQLIGEENGDLGKTIAYDYDTAGNMTYKTEYAYGVPYNNRGSYNYTTQYHYSYDSAWKDLLTSYTTTLWGQTPTVKNVSYPSLSTTTGLPSSYDGWNYTWQHGRELAGMSGSGKPTITFKYGNNGIRTQKTVNGVTTTYSLDQDSNVTYETNGTDVIYYTYDDSGSPISFNLNGTDYYYVKNLQGDTISIINASGTPVVYYIYDSWGKLINTQGTLATTVGVKNPIRYRGYRYDTETGLYYLQSRYYNPELGRLVSSDNSDMLNSSGDLLVNNLFAYCSNNPVMGYDPNGESSGNVNKAVYHWWGVEIYLNNKNTNKLKSFSTTVTVLSVWLPDPTFTKVVATVMGLLTGRIASCNSKGRGIYFQVSYLVVLSGSLASTAEYVFIMGTMRSQ